MKDSADLLYGSDESLLSDYGPALLDGANRLSDLSGWTKEERDTYVREAARTFHDAGIRAQPASIIHTIVVKNAAEPADEVTKQRWEMESRRSLRERFGIAEGDRRLAAVREFVSKRPAVKQLLETTGVGSHPEFITRFIEHAEKIRPAPTRPAA